MEFIIHLAIVSAIFSILGISLNLIVGYTGLLSVAHIAFSGFGAYATALLMTKFGFDFFVSVLAGIVLALLMGVLMGMVLSRFKNDYYALATLGFNFILFGVFLNWQNVTRGALGVPGVPRPNLLGIDFSSNLSFLVLAIAFGVLIYLASHFIANSSFGRVLKAIREDEEAITVFGYNTFWYKLIIFVAGGAMAAVAGSLFASYFSFIHPSDFAIEGSVLALAIIILGGLASLKGSVVGAVFIILLPELLRFVGLPPEVAGQLRHAIYGVLIILLMLYRPQGLMGEYKL